MTVGCRSVEQKASTVGKKRCVGLPCEYLVLWQEEQPAHSKLGNNGLSRDPQHQKKCVTSGYKEISTYVVRPPK